MESLSAIFTPAQYVLKTVNFIFWLSAKGSVPTYYLLPNFTEKSLVEKLL